MGLLSSWAIPEVRVPIAAIFLEEGKIFFICRDIVIYYPCYVVANAEEWFAGIENKVVWIVRAYPQE